METTIAQAAEQKVKEGLSTYKVNSIASNLLRIEPYKAEIKTLEAKNGEIENATYLPEGTYLGD